MNNPLSDTILKSVDGRFTTGDSFRLRHTECTSKDKDPAMTVTRSANGYAYYCHRCGKGGMVFDDHLTPDQTRSRIEANKYPVNKVTEQITLPLDFIPMTDEEDCPVPYNAFHWFWQYGLKSPDIVKYNCGWSKNYRRVIVPLYEYAYLGGDVARKLVGWVGREVQYKSKGERMDAGVVKYLTRAKKGKRRFFIAPGVEETVVISEDALSAMRVNLATGYTTVALLNTSVSDDLMRWLRGKTVYLWLDGDMLASSMKQVQRMRSLGLKAKHIHTPKDPKEYNDLAIRETLKVGEK